MMRLAVILALATAMEPPVAVAQRRCSALLRAPESGGWSEYNVRAPDGTTSRTRFAIVGGETKDTVKLVWLETRAANDQGEVQAVSQVLVPGFPYAPGVLRAAILQGKQGNPFRLNDAMIARSRRTTPAAIRTIADACQSAVLVGEEQVEVPAGKVKVRHFRNAMRGVDIWLSEEVPFGLVKLSTGGDKTSFELRERGSGARSSLRGEAREVGTPETK